MLFRATRMFRIFQRRTVSSPRRLLCLIVLLTIIIVKQWLRTAVYHKLCVPFPNCTAAVACPVTKVWHRARFGGKVLQCCCCWPGSLSSHTHTQLVTDSTDRVTDDHVEGKESVTTASSSTASTPSAVTRLSSVPFFIFLLLFIYYHTLSLRHKALTAAFAIAGFIHPGVFP